MASLAPLIARSEAWKAGHEKARGRAETDRALSEAHKLFDEIGNMLTEMRGELLGPPDRSDD